MNRLLTISPSPHESTGESVQKIMFREILALTPALVRSVFVFGADALRVNLVAISSCVAFEYLVQRFVLKG